MELLGRTRSGAARLFATFALAAAGMPASAAVTIDLFTSYGPTRFDGDGTLPSYQSPSYAAYIANVLTGTRNGTSIGDISTDPTAFTIQAGTTFGAGEALQTEFTSWRLDADPTGPFASENGTNTRISFVVRSDTLFDPTQLFERYANNFGVDFGFNPFFFDGSTFDDRTLGVRYDPGGGAPTLFTSGLVAGTELNELVFGGSGLGFLAFNQDLVDSGFSEQGLLDDFDGFLGANPFSVTLEYELRDESGAALASAGRTLSFVGTAAVPEPATWAMMIGGAGLVGGAMRRRRARPAGAPTRAYTAG